MAKLGTLAGVLLIRTSPPITPPRYWIRGSLGFTQRRGILGR